MNNIELTFMDALLSGDTSFAIERSEKREQKIAVENKRLPIKTNDHSVPRSCRLIGITDEMEFEERFKIARENNKQWTKAQYEKIGIKILDEYDDLFLNVELPEGWEVEPTEHSMWNNVIDNKGRKRITFFYKGAFYDRDAFTNFEKRYSYREMPFDDYKTDANYEERDSKEWYGVVYDCGKEIYRTKPSLKEGYPDDITNKRCLKYLNENYPLWDDINAYWD